MKNKIPESCHIIRFPDCDPFNHLNNSRYIDYFINAREDHLMKVYDFDIYGYTMQTGKSWVVAQNQIAYLSPAILMEKVYIQSTVLEWNDNDLLVEMRMWDEEKSKLKSLLWTRFIHFDLKNKKRIAHNEYLVNTFKEFENPLGENVAFEQRLINIKGGKYSEV